jgi:hypothetical protein
LEISWLFFSTCKAFNFFYTDFSSAAVVSPNFYLKYYIIVFEWLEYERCFYLLLPTPVKMLDWPDEF